MKPDVVILDLIMPLLSRLEAGRQLKTMMPAVKIDLLDDGRGSRDCEKGHARVRFGILAQEFCGLKSISGCSGGT
jgi:CheY-like chemotaxis protein